MAAILSGPNTLYNAVFKFVNSGYKTVVRASLFSGKMKNSIYFRVRMSYLDVDAMCFFCHSYTDRFPCSARALFSRDSLFVQIMQSAFNQRFLLERIHWVRWPM